MKNILVLCTGNSARSIMAEAYFNAAGRGNWQAYSAGSTPTGKVNPFALQTLAKAGISVEDARSKSWEEFSAPGAPEMDVVITVCSNAAGETCPLWPGGPQKFHWPFDDPAAATGDDAHKAAEFERVFAEIREAVDAFLAGRSGEEIGAERRAIEEAAAG